MMTDREKLATLICLGTDDSCKEYCNLPSGKVCVRCETLADCLIAHDVTVQKYGQWEESADGDGNVCSVCREDFCNIYLEIERFNYCPNCGARMEATYDC